MICRKTKNSGDLAKNPKLAGIFSYSPIRRPPDGPNQTKFNRMTAPTDSLQPPATSTEKGLLYDFELPNRHFDALWDAVIFDDDVKDRLLAQAVLNFTLRPEINPAEVPLHGLVVLEGPPGTGKTSLGRGLASKVAHSLAGAKMRYLEVEPHGLASGQLGRSQQAVRNLLSGVVAERANLGPLVVLLDEVETLAADRQRLSLEANPVDVHRATDAVLAQLDHLALEHPNILMIATSNFPQAIDRAFLSRADLVMNIGLPNAKACAKILRDTLKGLGRAVPKIRALAEAPELDQLGRQCVGLDGRRIRKLVLSALAHSKALAAAPEKLTLHELKAAVQHATAHLPKEGVR